MPGSVAGNYSALSYLILTQSKETSVIIIIYSLQMKKWRLGESGNLPNLIEPVRGRFERLNSVQLTLKLVFSLWGQAGNTQKGDWKAFFRKRTFFSLHFSELGHKSLKAR